MDEMDFGVCNVDCFRTITLYLSNITEVTAKWSLNYVKLPKKVTMSKYTETAWEAENLKKVDDPDVFEFSISNVSRSLCHLSRLVFRVSSKASLYLLETYLRDCVCLQCPWTTTKSNSFPRDSW